MDNPYTDTILFTKLDLDAGDLNTSDIYSKIKNKLIKKYEKKCNQYGYIDKIYKILEYDNGIVELNDFNAGITFNIKYSCRMCSPNVNDTIKCKVEKINKTIISAIKGPMIIIINLNININNDKFTINNNSEIIYKKNNNIITEGDNILVKIIAFEFHPNESNIYIYAFLMDYIKE